MTRAVLQWDASKTLGINDLVVVVVLGEIRPSETRAFAGAEGKS